MEPKGAPRQVRIIRSRMLHQARRCASPERSSTGNIKPSYSKKRLIRSDLRRFPREEVVVHGAMTERAHQLA